jgi:prephenate dehydratase
LKLGVLGPEGTHSERAARRWSIGSDLIYFKDFEDVLKAVERGELDAGVVPLENSLEGAIGLTMDLLLTLQVKIVGEVNVLIRHCLVGRGEGEVKVILSHPQALAQCRQFLRQHFPQAEIRTTGSTSHAAKLAQEFPEMAAIAGIDAAKKYDLKVLASDIQDGQNNITRFVAVGRDMPQPTGEDKTSLVVYLQRDSPGALYSILEEFAIRNINLTRIESRPSRKRLGDYYFYIDIEGHMNEPQVKEALLGVESKSTMVKVLGSYRKA